VSTSEEERVQELIREEISLLPYDPEWPNAFQEEAEHLRGLLPQKLIRRIEHFGSTSVPGLSAKPVVDMLVEVSSLEETKNVVVPILRSAGYEYFWRPTIDDQPPWYAWFIKRNPRGERTHHIHMVEGDSELWERLLFRDYLRAFPAEAGNYAQLKRTLSKDFQHDRAAYTKGKTEYIQSVMKKAKEYFTKV
jgi:GrpB-like predicted nucleotidyltransferase (UPF0157 family)